MMTVRNYENRSATQLPECNEGPEAFQQFDALVDSVLAVQRATLERRERAYRRKVSEQVERLDSDVSALRGAYAYYK